MNKINTIEDFKKIPIITKNELIEHNKEIQNFSYNKNVFSETSGSTGEPLTFYRNLKWDAGHRAAQLRGYSWHNVFPWEKNGYFWGYNFSLIKKIKVSFLDFILNRFRIFSYSSDEIRKFCKKLKKAAYLEGYSSMIYEVAKKINNEKLGPFNLKMIKGTSEKIFPNYQPEAIKAFGKKIISEYGAAEAGIIAFECKYGNMHITMENVIVEEENSEIIVTNLLSHSFPIIRYKLGDYISIDSVTICPCGVKHPIIKDIYGRIGKNIVGFNQTYPSLTLYYIFKNIILKHNIQINYQVVQKERGKLEINIDRNLEDKYLLILKEECFKYFKNDISVIINQNNLIRQRNVKFRDFISEL